MISRIHAPATLEREGERERMFVPLSENAAILGDWVLYGVVLC